MKRWFISVGIEGRDDEWEGWVTAPSVKFAVNIAMDQTNLRDDEQLHYIHVSPPHEEI